MYGDNAVMFHKILTTTGAILFAGTLQAATPAAVSVLGPPNVTKPSSSTHTLA